MAIDNRSDLAELGRSSAAPLRGVKIELGRRYRFAASHRLDTEKLSEEENARMFGKCANPHGHGDNYMLEISVAGDVGPATGVIANLAELHTLVEGAVCDVFAHDSVIDE